MLPSWPCFKYKLFTKFFRRHLSKKSRITLPLCDKVLVLHSQYNDPFLNLAYENWMYDNLNFDQLDVLYFWQNSPCVVIGRHQNPWLECDLWYLREHGVKLARRFSGGGTVYHDTGNLNITFFTNRSRYNRKKNLECIAKALSEGWNLDVGMSSRDDLVVDGIFKISGSAAKLGKYASYHHCTLLCDVDLVMLNKAIKSKTAVSHSRATQSVSSHVINLKDIESSLTIGEMITNVARTYIQDHQKPDVTSLDIFKQYSSGINKIKNELLTWEWTFGKTSPFTITKTIPLPSGTRVKIDIEIRSGKISNIALSPSSMFESDIKEQLRGIKFEFHEVSKKVDRRLQNHPQFQDKSMREEDFREILRSILKTA